MNLITNFRGLDGLVADFDGEPTYGVDIKGNKLRLFDDDGRQLARAELKFDNGSLVWILSRGKRGAEIGRVTEIEITV